MGGGLIQKRNKVGIAANHAVKRHEVDQGQGRGNRDEVAGHPLDAVSHASALGFLGIGREGRLGQVHADRAPHTRLEHPEGQGSNS